MRNNLTFKLTPNSLLSKCKRLLGISTFKLPLEDEELLDVLYQDTLPTFSRFYPRYVKLKIDLRKCRLADNHTITNRRGIMDDGARSYHLDLSMFGNDIKILDIEDIRNVNNQYRNLEYPNSFIRPTSAYDLAVTSFAQTTVESMVNIPPIYFYEEPDTLTIEEMGSLMEGVVSITFLLLHAYDLSTIKLSYIDDLSSLYLIDLKLSLYAVMKHYDKIDTTFGQIDLKIDDWADAVNERKEYLEKAESEFLKHRRKTVYRV